MMYIMCVYVYFILMRFVVVVFRRDKKCAQDVHRARVEENRNIITFITRLHRSRFGNGFVFLIKNVTTIATEAVVFREKLGINCV